MNRTVALLTVGLFLTACSTGGGSAAAPPPQPEPAPTLDPVGVYDFTTSVEGQTLTGILTITGSPGAYNGSMSSDAMGTIALRSFAVDGMDLSFMADLPDATVTFLLTFEGDEFTGEWDAGGMMGTMTGARR